MRRLIIALYMLIFVMMVSVGVAENPEDVTFLDVSGRGLTSLNLSEYPNLEILRCSDNNLISLNVSQNPKLIELSCSGNNLTSLNVSQNPNLVELFCYGNNLTSLNVSQNPKLIELSCSGNNLTSLDVSQNPNLERLFCFDNNLTSLNLGVNRNLWDLECYNNNLISLNASNNPNMVSLSCQNNALTSLDVSNDSSLRVLKCYANNLTSLNVTSCYNLELILCYNNNITSLDVSSCHNLEYLECYNNNLTTLKVSNPNMVSLSCQNNALTSLDVSNHPNLKQFDCYNNNLTSLNVSNDPKLYMLECYNNNLTSLNVSNDPNLWQLVCDYNHLTSLDVSNDLNLSFLYCSNNDLISLDTSYNTKLYSFDCYNNNLTSLDVSNNPNLSYLNCSNNNLTSLDVSNNLNLEIFHCYNNNLTSLDVSNNPNLEELSCIDNDLTILDVSKNTNLVGLGCSNNNLTSLDVSNNPNLEALECGGNNLTSLDVSNNSKLTFYQCTDNVYTIPSSTFDLSTLPGSFDITRTSNWQGGTVEDTILTATGYEVTYDYDYGRGFTASFKLISPPITLTLDRSGNKTVTELDYCEGNLLYSNTYSHDGTFYLQGNTEHIQVTLPKGFSFSQSDSRIASTVVDEFPVPIYSVYGKQDVSSVSITAQINGEEKTLSIPVTIKKAKVMIPSIAGIANRESLTLNHNDFDWINDFYSQSSYTVYKDKISVVACDFSISSYNPLYIANALHSFGFASIVEGNYNTQDVNNVGYTFGRKTIEYNGEIRTIVAVVIRGTYGLQEWIGNFIVGKGDSPATFEAAANDVRTELSKYCSDLSPSNTKMIITGHSRGGAVADLVAKKLDDGAWNTSNLVAYTYAAPNSIRERQNNTSYNNIHNYVFGHDIVAYVPQDYIKPGQSYCVGVDVNYCPGSVSELYQYYTLSDKGRYYKPDSSYMIHLATKIGSYLNEVPRYVSKALGNALTSDESPDNDIPRGHCGENYMSWVRGNGVAGHMNYASAVDRFKEFSNTATKLDNSVNTVTGTLADLALKVEKAYETSIKAFETGKVVYNSVKQEARKRIKETKESVVNHIKDTVDKIVYNDISNMYAIYKVGHEFTQKVRGFFFMCPISVELCDANGNTVATTSDYDMIEDGIMYKKAVNDSEIFFTSYDEWNFRITGTGDGYMNVATMGFDLDGNLEDESGILLIPILYGYEYIMSRSGGSKWTVYCTTTNEDLTEEVEFMTFPFSVIEEEAFTGSSFVSIYIPELVTAIESKAFSNIGSLKHIYFENGDLTIADDFLEGCPSTVVIDAPEGSYVAEHEETFREYLTE